VLWLETAPPGLFSNHDSPKPNSTTAATIAAGRFRPRLLINVATSSRLGSRNRFKMLSNPLPASRM